MIVRHRLAALFEPQSVITVVSPDARCHLQFDTAVTLHHVVYDPHQAWPSNDGGETRWDLAVVCVPADQLLDVLHHLSAWRPRALSLLTHPSSQPYDAQLIASLTTWAQAQHCLVLGPRSFGLMRPGGKLNASIHPVAPQAGKIAVVSQSRTIATALLDWNENAQVGFSTVVDLGEEMDVDLAAVLDYLAVDAQTDSIVLYLHSHPMARRFASAIYAASAAKPIIVLKAGGIHEGPALRAREEVFSALMRRVGAIRVRYLMQLYAALKVLSLKRRVKGSRIAIVSNGDGVAQLAVDIMRHGTIVELATLSTKTRHALERMALPTDRLQNPIARYAPWTTDYIEQVIESLAVDEQVDGILVLIAPDPYADLSQIADSILKMSTTLYKPLMSCFVGEASMRPLRHRLEQAGIPAMRTPDAAIDAINTLASYYHNQRLAQQILPAESLGRPAQLRAARALITALQQQGVRYMDEADCAQLLGYFQIPIQTQALPQTLPSLAPTSVHSYTDEHYGPYIVFGAAQSQLQFLNSRTSVALPPLNRYLARHLIERAPIWQERLGAEAGGAIYAQLQQALERLSELVSEIPAVKGVHIDPLWLSPSGLYASQLVIELHAQVVTTMPEHTGYSHMAIHPYPRYLVQQHHFSSGQRWALRPIRPEDAQALQEFVRNLSEESRYMRFVSMMRELSASMLSRYTRIDYDRELALVATIPHHTSNKDEGDQVIAFAHYLRNRDGVGAEYALVVADDWQRHGLGVQMMRALIQAATHQGLSYIDGYVLASNYAMLGLLKHLGFKDDMDKYDPSLRRVWLELPQQAS